MWQSVDLNSRQGLLSNLFFFLECVPNVTVVVNDSNMHQSHWVRGGRKYISELESVIPKISRNVEQTHENMVHSRVCSFGGSCPLVSGYREQYIKCKVCNLVSRYTLDVHWHSAAQ